jgi:hypothetical protein
MKAEDLLVLNLGGFGQRLDAFYSRLAADEGLRGCLKRDRVVSIYAKRRSILRIIAR